MTRKCLENSKVRHELGVECDPLADDYNQLQAENELAVYWLNMNGLDGDLLSAKVDKKIASTISLTSKGSKERQQLLKNAKSAGQRFEITRGSHLSCDDLLISKVLQSNELELKQMEKDKKERVAMKICEDNAKKLLEIAPGELKGEELTTLLLWKGIKKRDHPKLKKQKLELWLRVKDNNPPVFNEWTPADEAKMAKLQSTDIDINDTAIGRQKKVQ